MSVRPFTSKLESNQRILMSTHSTSKTPHEIIEEEKEAYLDELPEPDPDWPVDVRLIYEEIRARMFEWEGVEAQKILGDLEIKSNDAYSRFRHCTGYGIKEFAIQHRLRLSKRLFRNTDLNVSGIALSVGYSSTSGFSKTFKRHVGVTPSDFRRRQEI